MHRSNSSCGVRILAAGICALFPAVATAGDLATSSSLARPTILLAQSDAARDGATKKDAEAKPERPPLKKLTIHVVDRDGHPVAGAHVGVGAHFAGPDEPKKPAETDGDGFVYEHHARTNSSGIAELEAKGADLRPLFADQGIIVRAEKEHLAALVNPDLAKLGDRLDVTVAPECRVQGKVMSLELKKDKKPLGSTTVSLGDGDRVTLTYTSNESGDYQFFVPAGDYLLDAEGSNILRSFAAIVVPPNEHEMVFEPILATPSKLAQMEGQPAPELRGAVAWENGPPQTLASLKGKGVVLFFWRPSSADSLASVPAMIDLYEKLKKYLVVIGVAIDLDADKKPLDSVAKLEHMIEKARKESWAGRDIPFPVAIVPPVLTPFGENGRGRQYADSAVSADYGVTQYPTVLLIDRHGRLVGELDDSTQSLALLEKALGLRLSPTPIQPAKPTTPPPAKNPAHAK